MDDDLRRFLPPATAQTWEVTATVVPPAVYLAGGTGITAHLRHRISRDLDFFSTDELDLRRILDDLRALNTVDVLRLAQGTLSVIMSGTKVEFLSTPHIPLLRPTHMIAGIRVADLADIQAMKLRAVYSRGELRDYFDLMILDSDYPTEIGIGLYLEKFGAEGNAAFDDRPSVVHAIVRSLGYLDDVDDDPGLPVARATIERFWQRRQPQIARDIDRFNS